MAEMMRFRLRTLMIAMALGPPVFALWPRWWNESPGWTIYFAISWGLIVLGLWGIGSK